jgi:hypothetical protein
MIATTLRPPKTLATFTPAMPRQRSAVDHVRKILWVYFWLLIFEGALRKWLVPSLATPLLVIRDPVLLGAYLVAFRAGVFPRNRFVQATVFLAGISFMVSILATFATEYENLIVTAYGLRTNFFHLPLIFLMPEVFDIDDVNKFGRWILIISIPMAVLMVLQYRSGPYSFLNATAGGEGRQLDSVAGKIRPAGTFSFVTGIVQYYALVAVFVLHGLYQKRLYSLFLIAGGALSMLIAMAVSGSRSAVFGVFLVFLALGVCMLLNRALIVRSYKLIFIGAICVLALSWTQVFSEGLATTQKRFEMAGKSENTAERFLMEYLRPFLTISDAPFLGYGLGVGTNAGAAMLRGKVQFLLAEGEWSRIMLESGPIFGLAFILLRVAMTANIGWRCLCRAAMGIYLPALLFGACGLNVMSGQLGQPTSLGFAVFGGGLCLAACNKNKNGALERAKP